VSLNRTEDGETRKRGKYYQIRFYRNGQRIEESTGFTKWEDARDRLRDLEGEISKGVPITRASTRLTFDDARSRPRLTCAKAWTA
jgi:hypothetical protein